ncbi:MAG TPA: DUF427 domain-containing protein [Mycobacteriales bacterium]|nr:DUF427 domain-containing protein [Mycobacteriales bacterium]
MTATTEREKTRIETSPKRVRAYLGGAAVADSTSTALVWEFPHYPTYYFPAGDIRAELVPTGRTEETKGIGAAELYDVVSGGKTAPGAARRHPAVADERLHDLVKLDWNAMDDWFEEDELVYVHARNPYSRVDILGSSRHIEVKVDGVTVADSRQPRILFETGLPTRYYLPLTDVRMDLLEPSDTSTACPYKGIAAYWSVQAGGRSHKDLVWIYRTPLPESQKIAGMACFYNERVELYVDGVKQDRPSRLR